MNLKEIFESEETDWSVQGYIDEKELHDSIVDINKQNQNAVNEQLLNGKYDGITGEPVDVSSRRYVDIDAVLKDQEREEQNVDSEYDDNGRFSKNDSKDASFSRGNSDTGSTDVNGGRTQQSSSTSFLSENRMSEGFSNAKGFNAAGKALNMANRAADLALNSSTGKYNENDPTTPYMIEYDVAEKVLNLAGKGVKKTVKGAAVVGHFMKKSVAKFHDNDESDVTNSFDEHENGHDKRDYENAARKDEPIQEDTVFENSELQFSSDDGSIDGLIERLGIVSENDNIAVTSDSGISAINGNLSGSENHTGLMVISDSDIEDLSEKLGIVSENEIIHESGVMQAFESVAENHGIIVPDSENLSDTNLITLDENHALFDQDANVMQHDLEQKLGIYNKKSKKGNLSGGLANNIKNREKAIARERFKFMVSILINDNKGGATTDSGLGQIIFGGAARRIGGITGYFGKKIMQSLLPYVAAGLVALVLLLGGFLGIAGIIAFPLFTVMNVSNGAGRELTVMNQDFDYPSNQDYIYTRAVSLYEDFCYKREDIIAAKSNGINEFVHNSNTATDYFANAFSLVWAYFTTVDDENISNADDLIVLNPSYSFDVMQRVANEMFYYETEPIVTENGTGTRYTFIEKNYTQWYADKFLLPSHAAQNEYDLILSLTDGATPGSLAGVNLGDGTPPEAYDDALVAAIFAEGEKYLGVPYRLDPLPTPPTTFCCDIFVKYVFKNVGIPFPPDTYSAQGIYNVCTLVSPSEAKAGDLIFFSGTYSNGRTITHVGIYCGNGVMLHSGDPVKYTNVTTPYWQSHFYGFGRYGVNN